MTLKIQDRCILRFPDSTMAGEQSEDQSFYDLLMEEPEVPTKIWRHRTLGQWLDLESVLTSSSQDTYLFSSF
ncbi:Uncharacterized protein HZ326_30162 [Fusarium oxysporum f. sp. albedinis]|nr:Uncharacterized protein HZ326_30162 [Fusarium oxysporum f. sp. albedinis]